MQANQIREKLNSTTECWVTARVAVMLVTRALPFVRHRLKVLRSNALKIPDTVLREQALSSLKSKAFHCLGGAAYAFLVPEPLRPAVLEAIVSLQSISDYLDNLSDRTGVQGEAALRGVHDAFLSALCCVPQPSDHRAYYRLYPCGDDGGYLHSLVGSARNSLCSLPRYWELLPDVQRLAELYVELQVLKHLDKGVREIRLEKWIKEVAAQLGWAGRLHWWEFAAACGSTLGIFYAIAMASRQGGELRQGQLFEAGFFPFVCGLHILLDYFIDQPEDAAFGDLNFVSFYPDEESAASAIGSLWHKALECARRLPGREVNVAVVMGLPSFYLARSRGIPSSAGLDALASGPMHRSLLAGCRLLCRLGLT